MLTALLYSCILCLIYRGNEIRETKHKLGEICSIDINNFVVTTTTDFTVNYDKNGSLILSEKPSAASKTFTALRTKVYEANSNYSCKNPSVKYVK